MPASFNDLVALMARLRRAPDGCPWDREQTYATLAPMLLEEAYEAFEAVEDARAARPGSPRCHKLAALPPVKTARCASGTATGRIVRCHGCANVRGSRRRWSLAGV